MCFVRRKCVDISPSTWVVFVEFLPVCLLFPTFVFRRNFVSISIFLLTS